MIGGSLAGLFGACGYVVASPLDHAAQNRAVDACTMTMMNRVAAECYPKHRLEPGVFWERTGGKTHRVVIRREPEYVPDLSMLANAYGRA